MNNLILPQNESLTMSSQHIAVLTGKQHQHVKRDIEKMMLQLEIDMSTFGRIYKDSMNRNQTEYVLDRDQTDCLLTGYSAKARMAVIKRWKVLEAKQKPELTHEQQVLMIATQLIETTKQKEAALLEVDRIQGVCQTITAQFKTGMTPAKFCKQLNGVNVQQVNKTLIKLHKLMEDEKGYSPTSIARDDLFKANYGDFAPYPTLLLKGAKWLYKAYLGGKLPMKKTWDGKLIHMTFEG